MIIKILIKIVAIPVPFCPKITIAKAVPIEDAYEYLKTLEVFEGSEDV